MTDLQKYNTHKAIYEDAKEQADTIIASVNAELAKSERTQQDMQTLDGNYNNLIGLKSRIERSAYNLENYIENMNATSESWSDFLTLSRNYAIFEGTVIQAITNAKLVIDIWHKDNIVLDAEPVPIPSFFGEFDTYIPFKGIFQTLTKSLGKDSKKIRLIEACKGKAKERIQHAITGGQDFDQLWKILDDYYGSPKNLSDATISGLFNLKLKSQNIKDIVKHFNAYRSQSTTVLSLGHTTEELLVAYYLLQLPVDIRAKVEGSFADKTKSKHKFEDIAPAIDDIGRFSAIISEDDKIFAAAANVIENQENDSEDYDNDEDEDDDYDGHYSDEHYSSDHYDDGHCDGNYDEHCDDEHCSDEHYDDEQDNDHVNGYYVNGNYDNGNDNNEYDNNEYDNNEYDNEYDSNEYDSNEYDSDENDSSEEGDCVPNEYCWLCGMSGHYFLRCKNYWHGPETRERLKQLNKCDVCLTDENVQGEECSWAEFCHKCGQRHHYITCAGLQDNHPESYILNKR